MYQAIETKFLGPTNNRGARIVARAQAGRVTVVWDHGLSIDDNHSAAARAYAVKMGWEGEWHGGGKVDGTGNVYVRVTTREGVHGTREPHAFAVGSEDVA